MAGSCSLGKCDEVIEHHETLYNEDHGIKVRLSEHDLKISDLSNRITSESYKIGTKLDNEISVFGSKFECEFNKRSIKKPLWVVFTLFILAVISFGGFVWYQAKRTEAIEMTILPKFDDRVDAVETRSIKNETILSQKLSDIDKKLTILIEK